MAYHILLFLLPLEDEGSSPWIRLTAVFSVAVEELTDVAIPAAFRPTYSKCNFLNNIFILIYTLF